MRNVLISGGPVHAHIDAVKIVTNNFKGGRMAALADNIFEIYSDVFHEKVNVIYLCAKGATEPSLHKDRIGGGIKILYHNGYNDYRDKILELAPEMDAIILGAAVANLIPENPWTGKFPSHNYQEGDVIHIPFLVAPRIINMIKAVAKPSCHLFGFKLLKGVEHEELIDAAYEIVLDAKATCVFANDRNDLDTKYAVTKERGVHPLTSDNYARFIIDRIADEYYSTEIVDVSVPEGELEYAKQIVEANRGRFKKVGPYVFGTVAWRTDDVEFITTGRGKNELDSWTYVKDVDHEKRIVKAGPIKATLNAPLLHTLFSWNPDVIAILHVHETGTNLKKLPYAPPGTVLDAVRKETESFEIEGHGVFELIRNKTI